MESNFDEHDSNTDNPKHPNLTHFDDCFLSINYVKISPYKRLKLENTIQRELIGNKHTENSVSNQRFLLPQTKQPVEYYQVKQFIHER
jgi:hypothetical protein